MFPDLWAAHYHCPHHGATDVLQSRAPAASTLTQLRDAGDTLTLDNQAVVRWCQTEPHRECADRDLRDFIYTHTQGNPIPMRWIPAHRKLTQASTKQDREDIRRNNEVERWAKKAAGLPLPDIDPTDVSHVVIGGGGMRLPPHANGSWAAEISWGSATHIGQPGCP